MSQRRPFDSLGPSQRYCWYLVQKLLAAYHYICSHRCVYVHPAPSQPPYHEPRQALHDFTSREIKQLSEHTCLHFMDPWHVHAHHTGTGELDSLTNHRTCTLPSLPFI